MILTFRGVHNRFFIENLQYTPLTFFKELFTDTLCVERYAGPTLNFKYWTVEFGLPKPTCNNWTVGTGL